MFYFFNPALEMNFVDDAKAKVEAQKKRLEELGQKEIELAEAQQKLADELGETVEEVKDDVVNSSLGNAIGL